MADGIPISVGRPTVARLEALLNGQEGEPSYDDSGMTQEERSPARFRVDHGLVEVGSGRGAGEFGKSGSRHLFRHTAATVMVERGADIRYVQELLGH